MATNEEDKMPTARDLPDAASADNSLEGYAAINGPSEHQEIARLAYQLYEERGGVHGSHEEDWHRAEAEVRRKREPLGGGFPSSADTQGNPTPV